MKLSILMITYNHEAYLSQALESILMQEVDFQYEIVVGEDCSTDGTRSILLKYQRRYPDRIRAILPENNLGMMRNFMETYQTCCGDYVAILEGDDYWSSPHKLQKQIDFLDANPDFMICFHNAETLSELGGKSGVSLCPPHQKAISGIEDLFFNNFIPTVTAVFRNKLFGDFPEWFEQLSYGDWPLHLLNARFGKIGYLNEIAAVYRIHQGGAASEAMIDTSRYLRNIEGIINVYERFNSYYNFRYESIIARRIPEYYALAGKKAEESGQLLLAAKYYLKCFRFSGLPAMWDRVVRRLRRNISRTNTE
ncbi:MAG: glycosyltransferase [Desulfuromonadaceae bacterium]|nr:glycosyltransferase [Desulfuromonadaceae bacterium]MDD5107509.1 glycosyltransferase [Desulfuromonadaceae bacterium]